MGSVTCVNFVPEAIERLVKQKKIWVENPRPSDNRRGVSEPYLTPEINKLKKLTEKNKGQSPRSNKYRGKKTLNKYQGPEPKADTNFKGQCSDLEGYIFNHEPRSLETFSRTMQDMGGTLGQPTALAVNQPS